MKRLISLVPIILLCVISALMRPYAIECNVKPSILVFIYFIRYNVIPEELRYIIPNKYILYIISLVIICLIMVTILTLLFYIHRIFKQIILLR